MRVCWGSVWGVCELGASVCGVCECIASEWVGAMCVSDTPTHPPSPTHPHTPKMRGREGCVGVWVAVGGCECVGALCGVCMS